MATRKRVSLSVQVDLDTEGDPAEALHSVTRTIQDAIMAKGNVVRFQSHGDAHPIPTDEELAEIVGGGSRDG